MRSFSFFGVLFALILILFGCGKSDVSISLVKEGTTKGYETTTIGKAFKASFDSPKWEAFEEKEGGIVVQFSGKISKDLHDSVASERRKNDLWKVGEPVKVQWIVTPDRKSFKLKYMESPAWGGDTFEDLLKSIYKYALSPYDIVSD